MKRFIKLLYLKLRWWTSQENKHCKSFCVTCPYFERCVYDTLREKYLEEYISAKDKLSSVYGMVCRK